MPVDLAVLLHEAIADRGGSNEPALRGVLQERSVAAPAERIAVPVTLGVEQESALLQVANDFPVGVLEPQPGEHLDAFAGRDLAVGLDGLESGRPYFWPVA